MRKYILQFVHLAGTVSKPGLVNPRSEVWKAFPSTNRGVWEASSEPHDEISERKSSCACFYQL